MSKTRMPAQSPNVPDLDDTAPAVASPSNSDRIAELSSFNGTNSSPTCGYTVQAGDSLWDISKRFFGDGGRWPELYGQNADIVGADPNLIFPGQQLDLCGPAETSPGIIDVTEGGMCLDITEPTTVRSAMGDVQVYPDDYEGTLPEGAVTASHHERMLAVYENIAAGNSQVGIDVSSFTAGIDPETSPEEYAAGLAEAEAFQARTMENLAELMRTGVGLEFMEELDQAEHSITIQNSTEGNYTDAADITKRGDRGNGVGTDTVVGMNYDLSTYQDEGESFEPWMDERQQFGLYHELVHAYHNVNGTRAGGQSDVHQHDDPTVTGQLNNSELQAMGYGDYADNKYTDNVFREALGKPQRPHYSGWVP